MRMYVWLHLDRALPQTDSLPLPNMLQPFFSSSSASFSSSSSFSDVQTGWNRRNGTQTNEMKEEAEEDEKMKQMNEEEEASNSSTEKEDDDEQQQVAQSTSEDEDQINERNDLCHITNFFPQPGLVKSFFFFLFLSYHFYTTKFRLTSRLLALLPTYVCVSSL